MNYQVISRASGAWVIGSDSLQFWSWMWVNVHLINKIVFSGRSTEASF
jgi:hypothetical protein